MKKIVTICALIMIKFGYCQTQDSLSTLHLSEIVITGQFEAQSARQSVYNIRTIPMEVLQSRGATKLQDVLNTELNVRFTQDNALGGSNLSLQGLAGQNVKVLIDGVPMVGRQGTSNEININQINIQSIERIEVVEGPMSVVYGADALAGVINIITKKGIDGSWEFSAKAQEETAGREYGVNAGIHNQSLSGGYSWNKFFTRLDATRNYFGGWQGTAPDRDKAWHPKTQILPSGIFGFRGDKLNAYYRLDYLNEDIYNPGVFEGNEALDQNYITNRFMHQIQAGYRFSDRFKFNAVAGYTNYCRKTQTSTVNKITGDRRLALGSGSQDITHFTGLTTRETFNYELSPLITIQSGVDINLERGEGGRIKTGTQSIDDMAIFTSAELNLNDYLKVRPGIRVVHNSVYQAPPIIPSVNAKIILAKNHDLRLAYGRGFRAPSLRELYFDFFDASHSIEGNQNLEAELSHSLNASWNWRLIDKENYHLESIAGGFYNKVDNMIGYGQKPGNALITTYLNIDKFKTVGVTWNNKLKYERLDASLGFSYTGRFNQLTENNENLTEFTWSPEVISALGYKLPKYGLIFSLFHKYTGITPYYEVIEENGDQEIRLAKISDYHWADVTLQKDILTGLILTAGVRNIFDVININNSSANSSGAHTGGGARPIGYGRSYFISMSFQFNGNN